MAVTGGGFGKYAAELTAAIKYGVGVKHVMLDNHLIGKIGKEQLAADFLVRRTSLPTWAVRRDSHQGGVTGIRAEERHQLDTAVARLLAADRPSLLHVEQDADLL